MNTKIRPGLRTAAVTAALVAGIALPLFAAAGIFTGNEDVGLTPEKGSVTFDASSGVYKVTGGGANIWGNVDAFYYVYKQVSGDFSLSTDVHLVGQGLEAHRKAGLMIRQSLAADVPYVDILAHGDGLTALQYRETPGATTLEMRSEVKAPQSLRIERHGDQFTIGAGATGDLKSAGPVTVKFQDPVYVGLVVCSHNPSHLETAEFSNLKFLAAGQ